jgi:invasion protein IalB
MSCLRLFLFAGVLAAGLSGSVVVAQQPGAVRKDAPVTTGQKTAPQLAAALPNGASSINETYGDWVVDCRLNDGQKLCLLLQIQANTQTRQRIFEIHLNMPKDGKTEGTVLMPFGLKLDSGALLTLDDKDLGQSLRFSTCTPQGCLLPVSFTTANIDSMKKAKTLGVASLNLSNGEVVAFKVSLEGFAAAIARVAELGK